MTTRTPLVLGLPLMAITVSLVAQLAGVQAWLPFAVLSLALVWVLPGYALVAALFPEGLGALVRCTLAVPCSFMLCAAAGVVLDRTVGLRTPGFVLAVSACSLVFLAIAELRGGLPAFGLPARNRAAELTGRLRELRLGQLAAGGVGLVLLAGVGGWAAKGIVQAVNPPSDPFTVLAVDQQHGQLHVENDENTKESYRLDLVAGGKTLTSWGSIDLAPGAGWNAQLPALPNTPEVDAYLYRSQDTQPYRSLILRPANMAQHAA